MTRLQPLTSKASKHSRYYVFPPIEDHDFTKYGSLLQLYVEIVNLLNKDGALQLRIDKHLPLPRSFRPAFFNVSETRKCGNVFGKSFSDAEFIQRTLFRISDDPHSPDPRVW